MNKKLVVKNFFDRYSNDILTLTSLIGLAGTVYFSISNTRKSLETEEKPKIKTYLPTILFTGATAFSIILNRNHNAKTQLALISACTMFSNKYLEYKDYVNDKYKDDNIENEIIAKKLDDKNINIRENKNLYYEPYSDTFFEATEFDVIQSFYHFNRNFILRGGYGALNELYDFLGIKQVPFGDIFGWSVWEFDEKNNIDVDTGYQWVDFYITKIESSDGRLIHKIEYPFPIIKIDE